MARKLALIIGNSHYQDPNLARLVAPGEDVNDLTEVLRDTAIGGFDQVIPLINETDATIRLSIEDFFADKKPDDLLVIYFSGHGVRDEQGQLYLAVNNTRANRLRATAIPAEFITKEMDRSRSKRQVLILDCCHSGAFAQGAKAVTGESAGTGPAFEGSGYGHIVLTATDATQYAWEGDKIIGEADSSLFTHFMVEGLRTGAADTDGDGQITLDEMYDYVYEQVVTRTPKQTPGKWSYKQQGDIVIARNPRPPVKPVELPAEVRQLLDDTRPLVREAGVRELAQLLGSDQPGLALTALEMLKTLAEDDSLRVRAVAAQTLQSTALPVSSEAPRPKVQPAAEAITQAVPSTIQPAPALPLTLSERLRRMSGWGWAAGGLLTIGVLVFVASMLNVRGGEPPVTPTPLPGSTPIAVNSAPQKLTPLPTVRPTTTMAPTVTASPTVSPTPTVVPFIDWLEPNSNVDTAAVIGLGIKYTNLNFVPSDSSTVEGDKDYYKVRVKQGLRVICRTLDLAPGTDTTLTLYDEQQKPLGSDDDVDSASGDLSSRLTYTATYNGFLFLLVDQKFTISSLEAPSYTYSLACAPPGADLSSTGSAPDRGSTTTAVAADHFEPNPDFDQATTVGLGVRYTGLNFVRSAQDSRSLWDDDYYRVRVKPGQLITCRTLDLSPGTDTTLTLYNDRKQTISTNDDVDAAGGNFSSRISYRADHEGFLYLLVTQGFSMPDTEALLYTYNFECVLSPPPTPRP